MSELDHWQGYEDFAYYDQICGGPDSHLKTVVELARDFSRPMWAACLYVAVYNVPMAEVLKRKFPEPERLEELHVEDWLAEHWSGMIFRRERMRPVGSPRKLANCLRSCAEWVRVHEGNLRGYDYDTLWKIAGEVLYFGRYAQMKLLECLRQMGKVEVIIPDIRAKGGWSPREGLSLLYPEHAVWLRDKWTPIDKVEGLANETFHKFNERLAKRDASIDRYEFQVFLCDYKQVSITQRQYPGRSVDSELKYYHQAKEFFWDLPEMMAARRRLFPKWSLGEVMGWPGVREELGEFFVRTGRMWSDLLYDYVKSADDPYNPSYRTEREAALLFEDRYGHIQS